MEIEFMSSRRIIDLNKQYAPIGPKLKLRVAEPDVEIITGTIIDIPVNIEMKFPKTNDTFVGFDDSIEVPAILSGTVSDTIIEGEELIVPIIIDNLSSDIVLTGTETTIDMSIVETVSAGSFDGSDTTIPMRLDPILSLSIELPIKFVPISMSDNRFVQIGEGEQIPISVDQFTLSDISFVGETDELSISVDKMNSTFIGYDDEISINLVPRSTSDNRFVLIGEDKQIPMNMEKPSLTMKLVGNHSTIPVTAQNLSISVTFAGVEETELPVEIT
jgi:hypothetical protein